MFLYIWPWKVECQVRLPLQATSPDKSSLLYPFLVTFSCFFPSCGWFCYFDSVCFMLSVCQPKGWSSCTVLSSFASCINVPNDALLFVCFGASLSIVFHRFCSVHILFQRRCLFVYKVVVFGVFLVGAVAGCDSVTSVVFGFLCSKANMREKRKQRKFQAKREI